MEGKLSLTGQVKGRIILIVRGAKAKGPPHEVLGGTK